MTTAASDPADRPHASRPQRRPCAPPTRGWPTPLQSVLSNNTRRVYAAQWRIFENWCDSVGLPSLPAQPLTVARYLAVRAGDGAAVSPPCAWPPPPSPRYTNGPATILPAGTGACARR